jgi:hypothetical protein
MRPEAHGNGEDCRCNKLYKLNADEILIIDDFFDGNAENFEEQEGKEMDAYL